MTPRGEPFRPRGVSFCGDSLPAPMLIIDSVILNMIERACRKFQRLTGRTNVWLALQLTNLSIIVYFVWAAAAFWSADAGLRVLVGLFCVGLMYVLVQTVLKESIEAYESSAYRRVANGVRNPRRVRDVLLRISFLTLTLVLWYPAVLVYVNLEMQVFFLTYSLIVLTTAVLYLLACDPLPPAVVKGRATSKFPAMVPAPAEHVRREMLSRRLFA